VYRAGVGFANARITLRYDNSWRRWARRELENPPWAFSREEKEDTEETERDENVWRRTSIHGGVRGRALSTYRMLRRLLGPPPTFVAG